VTRIVPNFSRSALVAAVAAALCLPSAAPAEAQSRGLGLGIGIGILGAAIAGGIIGSQQRRPPPREARRPKSKGGGNAQSAAEKSAETDLTLARYDLQTDKSAVFKTISLKSALTTVGAEKSTVGVARTSDRQRNYDAALERFMAEFDSAKAADAAKKKSAAKGSEAAGKTVVVIEDKNGAITRNTIDRLIGTAYRESGLDGFERFAGENWTAARLKVAILDRATTDVYGMVSGPSAGSVSYKDVEEAIKKAAKIVYQNVFELSEILAVNRAVERFNQTALERGQFGAGSLGSGSEKWVTEAAAGVLGGPARSGEDRDRGGLADIQKAINQTAPDDLSHALRYRAVRVAVDCFVEQMIADDAATAVGRAAQTIDIVDRVHKLAQTECRKWLRNVVNGGELRNPMPQRVVWQADGSAQKNPAMFTGATTN